MSIIDERGRLFGRINLIDALVIGAIVILAPIAYAAYLLFRPAPITIDVVEPSRFVKGSQERVHITGKHLRPYLTAQFGHEQLHKFLIQTPSTAEALVPDLAPGVYDLALFDESEQVAIKKNAVTVLPPETLPPVTVRLVGALVGLDPDAAKAVAVGQQLGSAGHPIEILSAGPASEDLRRVLLGSSGTQYVQTVVAGRFRVPAILRAACTTEEVEQRCKINGANITPGQLLSLAGGRLFSVDEIRSDVPEREVEVVVQFVGTPDLIDQIKAGDRDIGRPGPARATVLSVGRREPVQGQVATRNTVQGADQTITRAASLVAIEATLRLAADDLPIGLEFGGAAVKAGAPFVLTTTQYAASGSIVRIVAVPPSTHDSR